MTQRSKLDWYKRNPAKFIGGTVGMAFEVKGAYSILLDLIYDGGGSCPDDADWICNILGVGLKTRRWNQIRAELIERGKLVVRDGRLFNPAASRMLARDEATITSETSGKSPKNTEKNDGKNDGKNLQSAKVDLFEDNGLTPTTPPSGATLPARARESQSQSQNQKTTADVVGEVEQIAEALHQKRGKYWATDLLRMMEEGITFEDVLDAAKAHRQRNPHGDVRGLGALKALARRKMEDRTWKETRTSPAAPATTASHSDMDWERALARLLKYGGWVASEYGPPPTRQGHCVPEPLFERWHTLWVMQGSHPVQELDDGSNLVAYPSPRPDPSQRALWEPTA